MSLINLTPEYNFNLFEDYEQNDLVTSVYKNLSTCRRSI